MEWLWSSSLVVWSPSDDLLHGVAFSYHCRHIAVRLEPSFGAIEWSKRFSARCELPLLSPFVGECGPASAVRLCITRKEGACSRQTQNLCAPARRDDGSRRLGMGIKPSRCACFLAALRARRTASAFSRVLRSDGFSYALRR